MKIFIEIVLIYMIIGAIYWTKAFYTINKSNTEKTKTIQLWNNLSIWDRVVVLSRLIVKWPIHIIEGFSVTYKALVARMEMYRIDKELRRRKKES